MFCFANHARRRPPLLAAIPHPLSARSAAAAFFNSSSSTSPSPSSTPSSPPSGGANDFAREERRRRAIFYVPGSSEKYLKSSLKSKADCFVYDLEDGVAFNKKGSARELVFQALEGFNVGSAEKAVRINSVGSGLEMDDLAVVLRSKYLQALLIPKVQSAKDIQFIGRMIDSIAPESNRSNIRLLAGIESALGIMNIKEISNADPRVDALIFAAEDYCADTGLVRTPSRLEMLYARQAVVTAACAYGLQAIDMVCVDFKSHEVLKTECDEGRQWGFTGKQVIHPSQVDLVQQSFLPAQSDVDRAKKIVAGAHDHSSRGIGAFNLDGKMIDMPMVKWAQRILARSEK